MNRIEKFILKKFNEKILSSTRAVVHDSSGKWKLGKIPTFIGIAVKGRKGLIYKTKKHFFFTTTDKIIQIFLIFLIILGASPGMYFFVIYPNTDILALSFFIIVLGIITLILVSSIQVRTIIFERNGKEKMKNGILRLEGHFESGLKGFNADGLISFKLLDKFKMIK
jgi:hypothetical protein